jgi:hypothetical protein
MTITVTRDDIVTPSPVTTMKQPQPATAAQRQRAYRMRSKRAVMQAIGEEDRASRVTAAGVARQRPGLARRRDPQVNALGPAQLRATRLAHVRHALRHRSQR